MSITDPRALAPFRKAPGVAFTIHTPRTNWLLVAIRGAQFAGGAAFVGLVVAALWSAT